MTEETTLNRFKVTREKLRNALTEAKAKHVAEVEEARGNFAQGMATFADECRKAIEVEGWDPEELRDRMADVHNHVPQPEDHSAEYDAALKKLEMMTSDTLWVTDQEFRQYVLDEWYWKDRHLTTVGVLRGYAKR